MDKKDLEGFIIFMKSLDDNLASYRVSRELHELYAQFLFELEEELGDKSATHNRS
jgi:hypothetical protein